MKCPHCQLDIGEVEILRGAAAIIAKRRRKAGNQMTSEEACERQIKSVKARKANTERTNDE